MRLVLGSLGSLLLVAVVAAGQWWFNTPKTQVSPEAAKAQQPSLPTETVFLNNWSAGSTEEWKSARSDHRVVAYLIAACRWNAELYALSPAQFSALLLDLTPTGDHTIVKPDAPLTTTDQSNDDKPASPAKSPQTAGQPTQPPPPAVKSSDNKQAEKAPAQPLSALDRRVLALSDMIARTRLSADKAASGAETPMLYYGYATIGIAALVTLLVTLQSRFSGQTGGQAANTSPPATPLSLGSSAGRWAASVAVAALFFSVIASALAGLKQYFDPTHAYEYNERALLSLRSLHNQVAMGLSCENDDIKVTPDGAFEKWTVRLAKQRANIIPATATFAAVGSNSDD